MPKKNNPGCGCCGEAVDPCAIFSDDYNRGSLGSDYTTVSGTPSISSNKLTMTSGTVLTCNTSGSETISASVEISGTSTNRFRFIISYVDVDNYYYVDVTIGGNIVIGERSGGSETTLLSDSSGTTSGGTYTLNICISGLHLNANIDNDLATSITKEILITTSVFGLSMQSVSGTPTFDNLVVASTGDGCPPCVLHGDCAGFDGGPYCIEGTVPAQFEVTITDLANRDCSDCTSLNGTYILDAFAPCRWGAVVEGFCDTCYLQFEVGLVTHTTGSFSYRQAYLRVFFLSPASCIAPGVPTASGYYTLLAGMPFGPPSGELSSPAVDCSTYTTPLLEVSDNLGPPRECNVFTPGMQVTITAIP